MPEAPGMRLVIVDDIFPHPMSGFRLAEFPTGCCMEAGLCGVAVFCTDPLKQNVPFKDREDIVIVPHDARIISETISYYHDDPERLQELAQRGLDSFGRVFNIKA